MNSGWNREDIMRYGSAALIAFLTVTNVLLLVKVSSLVREVHSLPRHIPSSNTYVNLSPLYTGVVNEHAQMASETMGDTLNVRVKFTLTERIPGYVVFVRFRERETVAWDHVRAKPLDGLEYEALLLVKPTLKYDYQIIQMLNDQIMRATPAGHINVADWVGSPTLDIGRSGYPNERKTQISVHQPQFSQIRAWQVDKVTIKLDNMAEDVVLKMFHGQWIGHKFDDKVYQAAKAVTVTAHYGDGEIRSVTFDPHNHFEQPRIKRD